MRWLGLAVAVVCYALAAAVWVKNPLLPSAPVEMSVEEALRQVAGTWKTYVSLDAKVDLEARVYSSPVLRPLYVRRPTDRVYRILVGPASGGAADLVDHLGVVVDAARGLAGGYVRLQSLEGDDVETERLLGPLAGTNERVWALSPLLYDDAAANGWLGRTSYEGPLTRMADIEKNLESSVLYHDLDDIRVELKREFGLVVDDSTYVILTEMADRLQNHFLAPVEGSPRGLFVVLTKELEARVPNPLVGILESNDREHYEDVGALLGIELPEKIGILSPGYTADRYNKETLDSIKALSFFGTIALFLGAIGFARQAARRWKARRAASA